MVDIVKYKQGNTGKGITISIVFDISRLKNDFIDFNISLKFIFSSDDMGKF